MQHLRERKKLKSEATQHAATFERISQQASSHNLKHAVRSDDLIVMDKANIADALPTGSGKWKNWTTSMVLRISFEQLQDLFHAIISPIVCAMPCLAHSHLSYFIVVVSRRRHRHRCGLFLSPSLSSRFPAMLCNKSSLPGFRSLHCESI
jgi:hypothetical protein